uniref:Secreted protein n=1 Tax=Oryza rufipogon TaxID=4529 RepID=A0A0E0NJH4_ORYRU
MRAISWRQRYLLVVAALRVLHGEGRGTALGWGTGERKCAPWVCVAAAPKRTAKTVIWRRMIGRQHDCGGA